MAVRDELTLAINKILTLMTNVKQLVAKEEFRVVLMSGHHDDYRQKWKAIRDV